ncbi:hypothetical protein SAMN05421780_10266 [Flexibacter flexilis DSM 6793]|uniref:Uncharacterized protein n=1 Tax=Flexibacter flexilis DSM 6793 TaxID=927664 RepID=A0A1I1F6A6_9BACT|nr:hypothetical protein [Flexibacter flexilis]SFB94817.1 hypothetical protein SAMN05421780_10266 [Flexibacter flexilis DSM 6793]
MEVFADFVKIIFPAAAVLFAMYLTIKAFLAKDFEKKIVELRTQNTTVVLPVRLQAYERICLLLERVSPKNLILRVNNPAYNVVELQQILLANVREEFNHNLAQQIYISNEAWAMAQNAVEDIVGIINTAADQVQKDAPSIELAKAIFEIVIKRDEEPSVKAIRFLKEEIRQVF